MLRVQYPGAIYHVMNRGDHREAIFVEDEDRSMLVDTLGEACQKTDWQLSPLRAGAGTATGLAAGGSPAWGVGHPDGQRRGDGVRP